MPRKKKERLIKFNQEHILETAEQLFSEKGIRQTTVDDIAEAADCSKSTLYVYFKSKEELLHYIICSHMEHIRDIVAVCVKEYESFESCYFRICTMLVTIYEQNPLYFESIMGTISVEEKDLSESEILQKIYDVGEETMDHLQLLFEKGVAEDYLKKNQLILPTVFMLWASLSNIILIANQKEQYIKKRMHLTKPEFLKYSFELLLDSIRMGGV